MKPACSTKATLNDLLDRILDKGLVLSTDVIIHVAGIPLLGIKLRAFLAGIQTMLDHGIWNDWDEAQRSVATNERKKKKSVIELGADEKISITTFSTIREKENEKIYNPWRPGQLLLTDKRIIMFRRSPVEILFSKKHTEIESVHFEIIEENDKSKEVVEIRCKELSCFQLHTMDVSAREFVNRAGQISDLNNVTALEYAK